MPELPEVETVRRGLAPVLEGRRLDRVEVRRFDLRWPVPADLPARVTGRRVVRLGRRAKYLTAELEDGAHLLLHLGMSGRYTILAPGAAPPARPGRFVQAAPPGSGSGPHDHLVFETDTGTRLVYSDHRRFGAVLWVAPGGLAEHPLLAGLGIEPTDPGLTGARLRAGFAGRSAPLKAALLHQGVIAGLGNIYVCEALHRARLSPRRKAGSLGPAQADRLAEAIRTVIAEAIEAGGSSLRDYAGADGELGRFQLGFAVYGREGGPCPRPGCRGTVQRLVQSGRSTFHCPSCQR